MLGVFQTKLASQPHRPLFSDRQYVTEPKQNGLGALTCGFMTVDTCRPWRRMTLRQRTRLQWQMTCKRQVDDVSKTLQDRWRRWWWWWCWTTSTAGQLGRRQSYEGVNHDTSSFLPVPVPSPTQVPDSTVHTPCLKKSLASSSLITSTRGRRRGRQSFEGVNHAACRSKVVAETI